MLRQPWRSFRRGRGLGLLEPAWVRTMAGLLLARGWPLLAAALLLWWPLPTGAAAMETVRLTADRPSGQPVGTAIRFTALVAGTADSRYRFEIAPADALSRPTHLRDYAQQPTFTWAPLVEGWYRVRVIVKEGPSAPPGGEARLWYQVRPRAPGRRPHLMLAPDHPLVALYSLPPCEGLFQVQVRPVGGEQPWTTVVHRPCQRDRTQGVWIGGLASQAAYEVRTLLLAGGQVTVTDSQTIVTGPLPDGVTFPAQTVVVPPAGVARPPVDLLLQSVMSRPDGGRPFPLATALDGQVVWYYGERGALLLRPGDPGRFLLHVVDLAALDQGRIVSTVLREIDLAGYTRRETTVESLNAQLAARGYATRLSGFHHEAIRLPSGHTLTLAYTERLLSDVQGFRGPVVLLGTAIIDLDPLWQVAWVWDAFDHLDVNRRAVLGEECTPENLSCPPSVLDRDGQPPWPQDWLHANALLALPDGHLLLSLRNQDWIVKIAYGHGTGDGRVLWRLGREGDFALEAPAGEPEPWFSHQHDLALVPATGRLVVYDNGNTRCAGAASGTCRSRGQVYEIDPLQRVARLVLNVDLGHFSPALGAVQVLPNDRYLFVSGFITRGAAIGGGELAQVTEVTGSGQTTYALQVGASLYRAYRLRALYGYRQVWAVEPAF